MPRRSNFNYEECLIPSVYCGSNTTFPNIDRVGGIRYERKGTAPECLKKGFGAGMMIERAKNSKSVFKDIKYLDPKYIKNMSDDKETPVDTLSELMGRAQSLTTIEFNLFLRRNLVKNGSLDKRAYNSVLMYLYNHGIDVLPRCEKIDFN